MRKQIFLILFVLLLFSIPIAHAHCPLCTAAVGAAAVSAKYFGVDTSIIGLLIGAFGVSTGLWLALKVKRQFFKFQAPIIVLLSFLLTVIPLLALMPEYLYLPLLLFGDPGSIMNKVYWINKMLFGSIIGGFVTLFAYYTHVHIKRIRGKVLFPFQGIILTIAFLAITSLGLYFMF